MRATVKIKVSAVLTFDSWEHTGMVWTLKAHGPEAHYPGLHLGCHTKDGKVMRAPVYYSVGQPGSLKMDLLVEDIGREVVGGMPTFDECQRIKTVAEFLIASVSLVG